MGFNRDPDPNIRRIKYKLTCFTSTPLKHNHQHHKRNGSKPAKRWRRRDWRNEARNPSPRNRHTLDPIRGCDGHVPSRSASFLNHADWTLVEPRLPKIHQETSSRIFFRYILKNDRSTIVQTYQHHQINGDKRFNCWRLVFVADGIKLMEGASEPKGRGRGWNQLTLVQTQTLSQPIEPRIEDGGDRAHLVHFLHFHISKLPRTSNCAYLMHFLL